MNQHQLYEHQIRELNQQLYNAYSRIKELQEQLTELRGVNGYTPGKNK